MSVSQEVAQSFKMGQTCADQAAFTLQKLAMDDLQQSVARSRYRAAAFCGILLPVE